MTSSLLCLTEKGLYCPAGDFYIDPLKAVDRAVTTHAHSDHVRRGSQQYICAQSSVGLIKARIGQHQNVRGLPFGQSFELGSAKLSFHPAGHILGSAQVRIEVGSEVWVVSGDYKREADPSCEAFESVSCDVFVTEATFGTPAYRWQRSQSIGEEIYAWWKTNQRRGLHSVVLAYSLGKSQRILAELEPFIRDQAIWIHPTLEAISQCYREEGIALAPTKVLAHPETIEQKGSIILAPPSLRNSAWLDKLGSFEAAFASGWMKGSYSRSGPGEKGFVISDHADWPDLLRTIEESGARQVYVQHRGTGALVRHLRSLGLRADSVSALLPKVKKLGAQLELI